MLRSLCLISVLITTWSYAVCPPPEYCGRDCWDTDGKHRQVYEPTYTTPTHIVVHHSGDGVVFPDGTDFKSIVQTYWNLHVGVNGWDDIGYNWLIDRNGVIYQARDRKVQGAHFSCMNAETIGICLIGDFRYEQPSSAALNALNKLIGWEADDNTIQVNQSTYHSSSQLELFGVCGHRDGNSSNAPNSCTSGTICPGPNLYSKLDSMRNSIETCENGTPTIYPNPTVGPVSIKAHELIHRIEVMNMSGQLIIESREVRTFDLSSEPKGIYIVRMYLKNGGMLVSQLVKR